MKREFIKVAVIGRPNVGKSTLFNRLIKERRSIVDDTPGVTRDRLYADIEWNKKAMTLIDTGGLVNGHVEVCADGSAKNEILKEVNKQVDIAIKESDCIIFLVDGKDGITSQDEKIADKLRKIKNKKKIFLAVNKIDTEKQLDLLYEFYSLGFDEPYPISALCGSTGLADLLDKISYLDKDVAKDIFGGSEAIKVAIVGKPNVGKSTILNCLACEDRAIVTSVAGTTRDNIDTNVNVNGQDLLLIDTAGLRRKSKVSTNIERYSTIRAISAIERADVVLFVIDASLSVSDQDQKIAALIKRRNKPSIILVNKWDLVENKKSNTINEFSNHVFSSLHFVDYSKILFTCKGIPWGVHRAEKDKSRLLEAINQSYTNSQNRISTGKLNKVIEDVILLTSPPSKKGKQLKIYYATQANIQPPEIVFFVNDKELVNKQYQSFLEKQIRNKFDFSGTPIKLVFRNRRKS